MGYGVVPLWFLKFVLVPSAAVNSHGLRKNMALVLSDDPRRASSIGAIIFTTARRERENHSRPGSNLPNTGLDLVSQNVKSSLVHDVGTRDGLGREFSGAWERGKGRWAAHGTENDCRVARGIDSAGPRT